MILLRDLDGPMWLHRRKDMFLHVFVCTSNDFKALLPDVWTGADKMCVLLCDVEK